MRKVMIVATISLVPIALAFAGDSAHGKQPFLLHKEVRPAPQQSDHTASNIRVDVNMALVPVTVLDSMGRNVVGLQPENFRVFEGSRQVPIATFSRQDAPVSMGLVFDLSASMKEKYRTARLAPAELLNRLDPRDESFLITISDRAELRQAYTSDFAAINNALLFATPDGNTSLLDGIFFGLNELKKASHPRKALVVVSDGGDNHSCYTLRETLAAAMEADTQIFAVGIYDNPKTQEETDGPAMLEEICRKTGGVHYAVKDVNELGDAMSKLGNALHNQYLLGYYPPESMQAGKYRKIEVQLLVPKGTPRLNIYARAGYYAQ